MARGQARSAPLAGAPESTASPLRSELGALNGVADLKFRDIFKLPVGPRGLEPSDRLLALDGQPVRLVGYMVRQPLAVPGSFILAPLPVALGDEDESFADDLPASVVYVHLARESQLAVVGHTPGLLALVGTLRLGSQAEADGRRSAVRLQLDAEPSRQLVSPDPEAGSASSLSLEKSDVIKR
jgi:hypothetical protein